MREDNTIEFYKEILKDSKPYKFCITYPDGHGNQAVIVSRINKQGKIQFVAIVIDDYKGVKDCFGFNEISKFECNAIIERFYRGQRALDLEPEVLKAILIRAEKLSKMPYEYVCWQSILLDIEPEKPNLYIEKRELNQKDVDKLCLSDYVQNWFFDEITSEEFKAFINKLSSEYKANNFDVDLDKFIADNFDSIYTAKELAYKLITFNIAAYLRMLKGDKELAEIFYSLGSNYAFLTNIIRKSIYEYYVGKRYILKNQRKTANVFEKKMQPNVDDFQLLQLDMIISSIEARWVDNA